MVRWWLFFQCSTPFDLFGSFHQQSPGPPTSTNFQRDFAPSPGSPSVLWWHLARLVCSGEAPARGRERWRGVNGDPCWALGNERLAGFFWHLFTKHMPQMIFYIFFHGDLYRTVATCDHITFGRALKGGVSLLFCLCLQIVPVCLATAFVFRKTSRVFRSLVLPINLPVEFHSWKHQLGASWLNIKKNTEPLVSLFWSGHQAPTRQILLVIFPPSSKQIWQWKFIPQMSMCTVHNIYLSNISRLTWPCWIDFEHAPLSCNQWVIHQGGQSVFNRSCSSLRAFFVFFAVPSLLKLRETWKGWSGKAPSYELGSGIGPSYFGVVFQIVEHVWTSPNQIVSSYFQQPLSSWTNKPGLSEPLGFRKGSLRTPYVKSTETGCFDSCFDLLLILYKLSRHLQTWSLLFKQTIYTSQPLSHIPGDAKVQNTCPTQRIS